MSSRRKLLATTVAFAMLAVTLASLAIGPVDAESGSGTEEDPYGGTVSLNFPYSPDPVWFYIGTNVSFDMGGGPVDDDLSDWGLTVTDTGKNYATIEGTFIKTGTLTIYGDIWDSRFPDMPANGMSVTMHIVERYRTVSFSSEGSIVHTETVSPGETVSSYTPEPREGYTFDGWYKDEGFTQKYDFSASVDSNITLYAKWIENPVTITFHVEGHVHSTLQVPKGSVGVVYTPVMVEGVFAGWYYDEALTQKYDATVALETDTDLYAYGVPPLVFTSEPNASAVIAQVDYGTFFFDATDSEGRYQIHWDFGDGNTSDEAIAYNTYASPGKYTVTLTITNIYGQSNTAIYYVDYGGNDQEGGGTMSSASSSSHCCASSEVVWSSEGSSDRIMNTCPGAGQCVVSGLGKPFTSPTEV